MKRTAIWVLILMLCAAPLSGLAEETGEVLVDNEYCRLVLLGADWTEDGFVLRVKHINKTGGRLFVRRWDMALDGVMVAEGVLPGTWLNAGETLERGYWIERQALIDMQFTDVRSVSFSFTGEIDEEEVFREPVTLSLSLPEGALPEPAEPIAADRWRGLDVELLSVEWREEEPYRTMYMVLRFTSRREEPISFNASALWINGLGRTAALSRVISLGTIYDDPTLAPGEWIVMRVLEDGAYIEAGVDTLSLRLYEIDQEGNGYPGTERIYFTLPETARDPRKTYD